MKRAPDGAGQAPDSNREGKHYKRVLPMKNRDSLSNPYKNK